MIYELRQYTAAEGRMEELQTLFRDVIHPLFIEVGIRPVGYWRPLESYDVTFVYLLAFESPEHRIETWPKFIEHPRWQAAREQFPDGKPPYVKVVPSVLRATDYSPLP